MNALPHIYTNKDLWHATHAPLVIDGKAWHSPISVLRALMSYGNIHNIAHGMESIRQWSFVLPAQDVYIALFADPHTKQPRPVKLYSTAAYEKLHASIIGRSFKVVQPKSPSKEELARRAAAEKADREAPYEVTA